jgi:hypothetical protein
MLGKTNLEFGEKFGSFLGRWMGVGVINFRFLSIKFFFGKTDFHLDSNSRLKNLYKNVNSQLYDKLIWLKNYQLSK